MTEFETELTTNIVDLSIWKGEHARELQAASIMRYLQVLSFHELIAESKDLIAEIKGLPYEEDLVFKAKLLLQEFKRRLKDTSPEMYAKLEAEFNI